MEAPQPPRLHARIDLSWRQPRIEELRSRYHAVLVVRERRDHEVRDEFATHTVG
jgi:hypothetical protein